MENIEIIDLTPETIGRYGVCGYKNADKHVELRKKIDWFASYYSKGLRIKALLADGSYQGMIEYIPGEYAHRPVDAEGYLFIHCIFLGFKKDYKGKGLGQRLIDACLEDAENLGMKGAAVVTRKGSFMADKTVFLKKGFEAVDKAKPDFDLLAKKIDTSAADPRFKPDMTAGLGKYGSGLTVLRSPQCPYTEKNVAAILEAAKDEFGLEPALIDLEDAEAAQNAPCPFGTFGIVYDGKVISHHPISKTRFVNIMKSLRGA